MCKEKGISKAEGTLETPIIQLCLSSKTLVLVAEMRENSHNHAAVLFIYCP
jgi:hypothetical protein